MSERTKKIAPSPPPKGNQRAIGNHGGAPLSVCYIDERKCSRLIKCLESYHKRYNAAMNVYNNAPVHDWASHFADAFRYCAMARALYRSGTSILTAEDWRRVREQHFPACS